MHTEPGMICSTPVYNPNHGLRIRQPTPCPKPSTLGIMKYLIALLAMRRNLLSAFSPSASTIRIPPLAPPCAVTESFDCGAVNHSRYAVFPRAHLRRGPRQPPAPHSHRRPSASPATPSSPSAALSGRLWITPSSSPRSASSSPLMLTYLEAYVIQKWCIYCLWSQTIISHHRPPHRRHPRRPLVHAASYAHAPLSRHALGAQHRHASRPHHASPHALRSPSRSRSSDPSLPSQPNSPEALSLSGDVAGTHDPSIAKDGRHLVRLRHRQNPRRRRVRRPLLRRPQITGTCAARSSPTSPTWIKTKEPRNQRALGP